MPPASTNCVGAVWWVYRLIGITSQASANVQPGADDPPRPDRGQWLLPPSTLRTWPVMNEASSDAMKTIAFAISSERPRRFIGTVVTNAALFSGVPVKRV